MPPFPDVRPLIVNLLARYIIQCKLDGYHGLPGQKSQQDWAHLLEVLCSTLDQPSKISYSSLQFVRYVSLLEKVQKIRMGKLSEHTLTDIYKMLVNFSKSPELSNTVIADKLTSLRNDMHSGLTGRVMAEFCTKVCDFVRLAMEWYATLPLVNITGDAIVAMEVTPTSSEAVADETTDSQQRGKKTAKHKHLTAPRAISPKPKTREGLQTHHKPTTVETKVASAAHRPSVKSTGVVHANRLPATHPTSSAGSNHHKSIARETGVALATHKPSTSVCSDANQLHATPPTSSAGSNHHKSTARETGVALAASTSVCSDTNQLRATPPTSSAGSSSRSVGPAVIKPSSLKQHAPPSSSSAEDNLSVTIQPNSAVNLESRRSSARHSVKVTKPPFIKQHAPKPSTNIPNGFEKVKPNAPPNASSVRPSKAKSSSSKRPPNSSNVESNQASAVTIQSDSLLSPGTSPITARPSVMVTKPPSLNKPPSSKVVAKVRPSATSSSGGTSSAKSPCSQSSSLKQPPSSRSSPNVSVKIEPTSPQRTGGSVGSVRPTVRFTNSPSSSNIERELNFSVKVEPDAPSYSAGSSGSLQPSVKLTNLSQHASPSGSNAVNTQNVLVKLEPNVSSNASNVIFTVKVEPSATSASSQISSVKVEPVTSQQANAPPPHPGLSNSSSSPGPSHRHTTKQPSASNVAGVQGPARTSVNYNSLLLHNLQHSNASHHSSSSNALPPSSSMPAPSSCDPNPPSNPHAGSSPKEAAVQRTQVRIEPNAGLSNKRKRNSSPPPLIYMSLVTGDNKNATDSSSDDKPFATRRSNAEGGGIIDVTNADGAVKASGNETSSVGSVSGSAGSGSKGGSSAGGSSHEDNDTRQKKRFREERPPSTARTINCNGTTSASGRGVVNTGSSAGSTGRGIENTKVEILNSPEDEEPGESSVDQAPSDKGKTRKFGIFDLESFYSKEMEWSSDESDSISSSSPKKQKLSTAAKEDEKLASDSPHQPGVKRGVWSEEEAQCLTEGVEIYGEGRWKEIREAYSVLGCRTTGQLKDKYRNLKGRFQQKPLAKEQHVNKRKSTRSLF